MRAFQHRRNIHSAPNLVPEHSPPQETSMQGENVVRISSANSQVGYPQPPEPPQTSELMGLPHIFSQLVDGIQTQTQVIAGLQVQFQEILTRVAVNQQGMSNPDHASLIKGFRRMSPPIFRGECNEEIAEGWIREIEEIFGFIHCPDGYKVILV